MNQHWLRKDEQQEVIERLKEENGVTVKKRNKIKSVVVKGEGIFKCYECGNLWTSHHTSIRVNLLRAYVFKRYGQKCQQCWTECWVLPHFTGDRFEEIISQAIHLYEMRKNGYHNNRPSPVHGNTQGPHKMEDCERCQELGRRC